MSDYATADEVDALKQLVNGKLSAAANSIEKLATAAEAMRAPSKALTIGYGPTTHAWKAPEDEFLRGVLLARSADAEEQREGKAILDGISSWQANTKAALGTTDATGGWIIPNAIVDSLVKPTEFQSPYLSLMTVITGVNAAAVDIPFRTARPARAVIASWGSLKENVDLSYQGYTATMYTLARIHDLSNQLLKHSDGAAQRDAISELGSAWNRGVGYYLRSGSGTGEPYGFATAIAAPPFSPVITTSHTAAANTVAGHVASAIGKAAAALMGRGYKPTAVVMSPSGYAEMVSTGTDTGGWLIAGLTNTSTTFAAGTLVSPWGLPCYVDMDMTTSDDLYVADWKQFRVYLGDDLRIDTSSVAGTRWDYNVTGVRLEGSMGFDARPAVYAGALEFVADILS